MKIHGNAVLDDKIYKINELFKDFRVSGEYTFESLAEALGVSQIYLRRVEHGEFEAPIGICKRLYKIMGKYNQDILQRSLLYAQKNKAEKLAKLG